MYSRYFYCKIQKENCKAVEAKKNLVITPKKNHFRLLNRTCIEHQVVNKLIRYFINVLCYKQTISGKQFGLQKSSAKSTEISIMAKESYLNA